MPQEKTARAPVLDPDRPGLGRDLRGADDGEHHRIARRGLLVGLTYRRLDVAGCVFNPDDSKPIVVVSVRVKF